MCVGSRDVGGANVLDDCSKHNPLESFKKFETTHVVLFEVEKFLKVRQQTGIP